MLAVLSRVAAEVPPLQLTAMGFAVSGAAGLAWLAATGNLGALAQPALAWAHGVGGLFGFHALYFASLALAPAAQANLINYTWPLLIVLFSSALLGLRLRRLHVAGVALGAAGCALLLSGGTWPPGAMLGYTLAAASALTWALYSVLSRRFAAVPPACVFGYCAASAALAGLAHWMTEPTILPTGIALAAVVALGLGPLGAAFVLWDVGMKRGDPRLLGTLAYATPVASTLLLCVAGEAPLTAATLLAATLVTLGGILASLAPATA